MEVEALYKEYEIWAIGNNSEDNEKYKFIQYPNTKQSRNLPKFHMNWPILFRKPVSAIIKILHKKRIKEANIPDLTKEKVKHLSFDLIIAHHIWNLPTAFELRKIYKCATVFNAHEYYTKEFEEDQYWVDNIQPYYLNLAQKYYSKCDEIWAVSPKICEFFEKEYQVNPVLVENTKKYENLAPTEVNPNKITLVHHGGALPSRGIEIMINLMDILGDNYHMYFYLVPSPAKTEYFEELKILISKRKNITLCEPVPIDEISKTINKYDIGCYILKPSNFNNRYALPNKFFEFIQARLMLAIGPSDEMKSIVERYQLGVVSKDFSAKELALEIQKTTKSEIENYKKNTNITAAELNIENNFLKIKDTVERLIK